MTIPAVSLAVNMSLGFHGQMVELTVKLWAKWHLPSGRLLSCSMISAISPAANVSWLSQAHCQAGGKLQAKQHSLTGCCREASYLHVTFGS